MSSPTPGPSTPVTVGTPLALRAAVAAGVVAVTVSAYQLDDLIGPRGRSGLGVVAFIGLACVFSADLRRVNWRTIAAGLVLQFALALLILQNEHVYAGFQYVGEAIKKFLDFTNKGSEFVFGPLAQPGHPAAGYGAVGGGPAAEIASQRITGRPYVFAFMALPAVIFVSSFFTVLYHLGVLQFVVRVMAWCVVKVMGTSGAETLSAVANVFMGQTEAPLIVKPYIRSMTRSELLALMVGGMATVSGGVMVAYLGMGADAVALLTTSVMAAPAGLYLAKILMPETGVPVTRGVVKTKIRQKYANVFDAAAGGASQGMKLVLNIAAMLIAFIAFIWMGNHLIGKINPTWSLEAGFAVIFDPAAVLMGVPDADVPKVAEFLGTKLVLNEFVAFAQFQGTGGGMSDRAKLLTVFALTGFANFSSVGIQLGGIGGLAPKRRADLARLSGRALLGGFLATLVNAAVAGLLTP